MKFTDKSTYQYLLGPDVFVAPVLEAGGGVTVVFPDGDWVDLFDDSNVYHGDEQVNLVVPLEQAAVFLRQGSNVGI